jgi:hypothetical protein
VSAGGRGGRVIKVTNLNASGPGSLQEACSAEGPRIVVFEVSGVIHGGVRIEHPYITIAGQTAPGAGITIEGKLSAGDDVHDVIVRFLRLRPKPTTGHTGDTLTFHGSRIILDHVSMSWASDEVIDIITASDVTLQWCSIEESDIVGHEKGVHNYALLAAYQGTGNISIHHNLFAHHMKRLPSLSPYEVGKPGDVRNNVIYNFRHGLTHDGHIPYAPINLIGNYYKRGPNSDTITPFSLHSAGEYYIAGNFIEEVGQIGDPRDPEVKYPSWVGQSRNGVKLTSPAEAPHITTHSAEEAYSLNMAHAGCLPRDRVLQRTIEEIQSGTGEWGRNAPASPSDEWYLDGLQPGIPPTDSDNDGMPDDWEDNHGLNKHDPDDHRTIMPSRYTAIEEYINDLAHDLINAAQDTVNISSTFLPEGVVGEAYHQVLYAIGGRRPYDWRVDSGSLPPGLSLSNNGILSGIPTTAGHYSSIITVADSADPSPSSDTKDVSITIEPPDNTPPTVVAMKTNADATKVIIGFNELIEEGSAENFTNYSIDNGVTIESASLGLDRKTVTIVTSPHSENHLYTLTVDNVQDLAGNSIKPNSQFTYNVSVLIRNLTVSSGKDYDFDILASDALVYIDRGYRFIDVPSEYSDLDYIMTANDDKWLTDEAFLSFDVTEDVIIYVAYDSRASSVPNWLSSWTDTGRTIFTTDAPRRIYEKEFTQGTVILGANYASGVSGSGSKYSVIIARQGEPPWPLLGDLDGNGQVDVLDLQLCVNIVLGFETNPEIVSRADLNGDGAIDILDVQEIAIISSP